MEKKKFKFIYIILVFIIVVLIAPRIIRNVILSKNEMTFPPDYSSCTGIPFYSNCINESCIEGSVERRVFDIWKKKFLLVNNIEEEFFNNHFEITDVTFDNNMYAFVSIEYVYKNDWVRSRERFSMGFGERTNEEVAALSDEEINKGIDFDFDLFRNMSPKFNSSVISLNKARRLINIRKLLFGSSFDYCSIDFDKDGLMLSGWTVLSYMSNTCYETYINLFSGKVSGNIAYCWIID